MKGKILLSSVKFQEMKKMLGYVFFLLPILTGGWFIS
jgi:hypothetical protein